MPNENMPTEGQNSDKQTAESALRGAACSVSFDVGYFNRGGQRTHGYQETWEPLELFCHCCGSKSVWRETGPGDYYVEELYMCSKCGRGWHMPGGTIDYTNDQQGAQRLKFISQTRPS